MSALISVTLLMVYPIDLDFESYKIWNFTELFFNKKEKKKRLVVL